MDLGQIAGRTPRFIRDEEREASVLVPVIERRGDVALLFTKRADNLGEHPGQMSFPGGSREPSDVSKVDTALREAREEVGLDPQEAEIIGPLDDIRTTTRYVVTPYVATIPDRLYEPDEREVAEIVVLPIESLCDPNNCEIERREHPYYGNTVVHYFHVDGYTVWGATGRIVAQFLGLVMDWDQPVRYDRSNSCLEIDSDADMKP